MDDRIYKHAIDKTKIRPGPKSETKLNEWPVTDVAVREMRQMTATYGCGSRDAEHVRRTGGGRYVCVIDT